MRTCVSEYLAALVVIPNRTQVPYSILLALLESTNTKLQSRQYRKVNLPMVACTQKCTLLCKCVSLQAWACIDVRMYVCIHTHWCVHTSQYVPGFLSLLTVICTHNFFFYPILNPSLKGEFLPIEFVGYFLSTEGINNCICAYRSLDLKKLKILYCLSFLWKIKGIWKFNFHFVYYAANAPNHRCIIRTSIRLSNGWVPASRQDLSSEYLIQDRFVSIFREIDRESDIHNLSLKHAATGKVKLPVTKPCRLQADKLESANCLNDVKIYRMIHIHYFL